MEEGRLESKTTVAWINSLLTDIYNVERDTRKSDREKQREKRAAVAKLYEESEFNSARSHFATISGIRRKVTMRNTSVVFTRKYDSQQCNSSYLREKLDIRKRRQ